MPRASSAALRWRGAAGARRGREAAMVNELIAALIGFLIAVVVCVKLVAWALIGAGKVLMMWISKAGG